VFLTIVARTTNALSDDALSSAFIAAAPFISPIIGALDDEARGCYTSPVSPEFSSVFSGV
jgi:hypothetical protein